MIRPQTALPLAIALALAACTATPSAAPVAQVTGPDGGQHAVRAGERGWQVMVDGTPVPCPRPEAEACYWALRVHQAATAALDDATG